MLLTHWKNKYSFLMHGIWKASQNLLLNENYPFMHGSDCDIQITIHSLIKQIHQILNFLFRGLWFDFPSMGFLEIQVCKLMWYIPQLRMSILLYMFANFHSIFIEICDNVKDPGTYIFKLLNRSPVNSTHKGQWRGVLMFSLIIADNADVSMSMCWLKGTVSSM